MPSKITVHVSIAGKVQQVGYRQWLQQTAEQHGLDGWVRNRADQTVEAVLCGEADIVRRVLALCHEGPGPARVGAVRAEPCGEAVPEGFVVRPTV